MLAGLATRTLAWLGDEKLRDGSDLSAEEEKEKHSSINRRASAPSCSVCSRLKRHHSACEVWIGTFKRLFLKKTTANIMFRKPRILCPRTLCPLYFIFSMPYHPRILFPKIYILRVLYCQVFMFQVPYILRTLCCHWFIFTVPYIFRTLFPNLIIPSAIYIPETQYSQCQS